MIFASRKENFWRVRGETVNIFVVLSTPEHHGKILKCFTDWCFPDYRILLRNFSFRKIFIVGCKMDFFLEFMMRAAPWDFKPPTRTWGYVNEKISISPGIPFQVKREIIGVPALWRKLRMSGMTNISLSKPPSNDRRTYQPRERLAKRDISIEHLDQNKIFKIENTLGKHIHNPRT